MDSEVYNALSKYKQNGKYPADVSSRGQKKDFRRTATKFVINDGLLFYVRKKDQLHVIKEEDKERVMRASHDDLTSGGHFAWEKTWGKLKDRYYWKGMSSDVKEWCRSCEKCQRHNKQGKMVPQELHPIPVPSSVMCQVGIDFVGPKRTTASGNNSLLVMTDYKSKWPEVQSCPDMSAVTVAKFIYKMICRHGTFRIMISDRGRAFVNELNDWLCEKMKMKHQLCSPYHPQSNGQTERFNGTLTNSLEKLIDDEGDWDEYVDGMLFAYRSSIHASTKVTPFEIVYGRRAVLPFERDFTSTTAEDLRTDEVFIHMSDVASEIRKTADKNILKAQKRYKKHFDGRNCKPAVKKLCPGTQVLIKNMRNVNRKGDKMAPKFTGPYTINKVLPRNRVTLVNSSGIELKTVHNITNLKLFKERNNAPKKCSPVTLAPENTASQTKRPAPENTASQTKRPATENTASKTKRPAPENTASQTKRPAPENTASQTKRPAPENTASQTKRPRTSTMRSTRRLSSIRKTPKQKSTRVLKATRSRGFVGHRMSLLNEPQCLGQEKGRHTFEPVSASQQKVMCQKLNVKSVSHIKYGTPKRQAGAPKQIHKTKGDGNCYFRAISYCVSGSQRFHQEIRDKVVEHMADNVSAKLEDYLSINMDTYMDQSSMILDGVWATDAEILATADLLGVDIRVYGNYGASGESLWQSFPASFNLDNQTSTAIYLQNLGVHYDVVLTTA